MLRLGLISDDLSSNNDFKFKLEENLNTNDYRIESIDRYAIEGSVTSRILSLITISDVIIAYIKKESLNILYEIGLAHGLNKPVIIITSKEKFLPTHLLTQKYIVYDEKQNGFNTLIFMIKEIIKNIDKNNIPLRGPHDNVYEPVITMNNQIFNFRDLFAYSGFKRNKLFKIWFTELAKGIPDWNVMESENRSSYFKFDLMIWNSLNDPELQLLGNPIPIELRSVSSFNKQGIETFLFSLKRSGLKSIILATSGINEKRFLNKLKLIIQEQNIKVIALDRNDFLEVDSSLSLFELIKRKFISQIYGEDNYV